MSTISKHEFQTISTRDTYICNISRFETISFPQKRHTFRNRFGHLFYFLNNFCNVYGLQGPKCGQRLEISKNVENNCGIHPQALTEQNKTNKSQKTQRILNNAQFVPR